ncbi:uncharacterized protein LOC135956266 [Calliphora vicina]|uniref:uncharacterized protein LOC135956266 n=1 Tax=Calliphora vicina TaxID=7373 RepID=UPI00325A9733
MEFALSELLSRDDILRILNERQLPVQNMNELTHDELLRVYKTFVMPLSQRPERSKRIKESSIMQITNSNFEEQNMQVEPVANACTSMDIDFPSNNRISPVGEKRRQRRSDDDYLDMMEYDYQYQLSSVTKRIRINSS